jgi:hypothetical protein
LPCNFLEVSLIKIFISGKQNNDAAAIWSRVLLETSGKVGIGTTSPTQTLDVAGDGAFKSYLRITNTAGEQKLLLGNQNSAGVNNPAILMGANGNLYLGNGNSWVGDGGTMNIKYVFTSEGKVGIGTTSPTEKLSIYGITNADPGILSLESSRNDLGDVEVGTIKAKNSGIEIARIGLLRGGGTHNGF